MATQPGEKDSEAVTPPGKLTTEPPLMVPEAHTQPDGSVIEAL